MCSGKQNRKATTPSITDVARHAGVSHMTVSRFLNKSGYVKAATAARVEASIQALGYRRNPMVQALMSQVRRKNVNLDSNIVWIEEELVGQAHNAIAQFRDQARRRADELGFGFDTLYYVPGEFSSSRIDTILNARGTHGVIIAPKSHPSEDTNFPWNRYAAATIGRSLLAPTISYVMMHFQHAMSRALSEIKARGYQRIGFLVWEDSDSRSEHIPLMVFLRHNYQVSAQNRIDPLWMDGMTREKFQQWYHQNKPDVIVSSWMFGWNWVQQLNVQIPEDLGFVSLSLRGDSTGVSGMNVPIRAIGLGAVDIVVAQIQRNEIGLPKVPKCLLVEGSWSEGKTLRT
ncbi:LacI family DNA-binding transcriptional regulator [Coraliomargarita sp. SDUM461004]|uniref:LacI family DNA-binding transcriptional regulator n=1 Tax=Thalassobacterium sedimentorum TaxID=3041258 RepID=A0ABU1AIN5_9BACT|nr:LacI family DNA-binding transcriptional regulator [Coraliomargarita sp. SDUM461004]MDQ8194655.1 LacI family DNA-binding transcriptional regulator [Coraliomargarita sp. SDUM461004]